MKKIQLSEFKTWEDLSLAKECVKQSENLDKIRVMAEKIDLKNVSVGELIIFVKSCRELTK